MWNLSQFYKIKNLLFIFGFIFSLFTLSLIGHALPTGDLLDQQMQALWSGKAQFVPLINMKIATQKDNGQLQNNGMNQGTQIVPFGKIWYLFNRELDYTAKSPLCRHSFARIVVRQSVDHGKTWSKEAVVASPDLSKGECELADGHAYYDKDTGTWHYLTQMLTGNPKPVWNINHYTFQGQSPMAQFTPDFENPVVRSGQLWRRICGASNACPMNTNEEGTPEISEKKNGFFYVTFHGSAVVGPHHVDSYRGIAKTRDFHSWITQDIDIPNAPIWSSNDCQRWNVNWNPSTGCIGGGHASTLITPQFTYMLIESADLSSICTPGQNWVAGLVRAKTFVPTGHWQQYPRNPLLNENNQIKCAIQYQRLFQDNGNIYMSYWTTGPTGAHDPNTIFHIEKLAKNSN